MLDNYVKKQYNRSIHKPTNKNGGLGMKLNYKRTILVGFAFFLITAFWQAYDATIPVILTNKFGMNQTWSGVIMALDNILAVVLLPVFGAISDRCVKNKRGKRTPFIMVGTIIAAIAILCLSFVDHAQLKNISDVSKLDDPAALEVIYDTQGDDVLMTPEGENFVLSQKFTKEYFVTIKSELEVLDVNDPIAILEKAVGFDASKVDKTTFLLSEQYTSFDAITNVLQNVKKQQADLLKCIYDLQLPIHVIEGKGYILAEDLTPETIEQVKAAVSGGDNFVKKVTNAEYTNYVSVARQAYAADRTEANPAPLRWFVALLLVVLVAMSIFRSPAVALMPDVTIKPLRSKGNAVINLMGTAGGILVLVLGMVFATSAVKNQLMTYYAYYGVVAALMLAALGIFLLTVKEKEWARQMREDSVALGIEEEEEDDKTEKRKLCFAEKRSLLFILLSIALWYFGYNAVTSKYAVYAGNILNMNYNTTLLLAQAAAIVAYLPAGMIASKIGRRKTILAGVVMLTVAFGAAAFMRAGSPEVVMYILFALAGIGWATINVNSFPMVVEMCSGGDIGKYTGFYYTASMIAQILTPMLSGMLMDKAGMTVLFPYAAIFVGLAFVTMLVVRHGDVKVEAKKGLEAFDND